MTYLHCAIRQMRHASIHTQVCMEARLTQTDVEGFLCRV